jgi:prepilin-type N-terminal cleavage/methylation domain-containing protein/prepilin-type processing-associated H-X9-DG protein
MYADCDTVAVVINRKPIGDSKRAVRRGFTLIELLVVVAIIAILAALLTPGVRRAMDASKAAGCLYMLRKIGDGVRQYMNDHDQITPPYMETFTVRPSVVMPNGDRYNVVRRSWTQTEWFKSGPYQHWFRDGDGFLAPYLGTHKRQNYGIPFCPAAPEGPTTFISQGVSYPMIGERRQSLGTNLDATSWFFDSFNGISGRDVDEFESPSRYVISADNGGQTVAVQYTDQLAVNPRDFTASAPIERHHGEYFNASFLDGHAEPCTHEVHYTHDYWCQPRGNRHTCRYFR